MTTARSAMQEVGHKVAEPSADGLFGVVWERRGLSKRERRLITVQVLTALYRTGQFPNYVHRTLNAGSSKEENGVLIVDNTVYAGLRPPNRPDHGAGVRRAVDELEARVSPPANPATD